MVTDATLTVAASDDAVAVLCFLDGREVTLTESVVVGRDAGCDLPLPASAKQSSSTHAIIREIASGRRMLKDLGSKNGTFVNGTRVEREAVTLEAGDLIQFGEGGPSARYTIRTREAKLQPRRPTMGYGITLARTDEVGGEASRLEWRDKVMISLGRDADADLAFSDPAHANVSGRHARIRYTGRSFQIQDQGKNGTFVNGERVESIDLESGDIIELGPGGPKLVVEAIDIPGQSSSVDVDEMQSTLERIEGQSRRRTVTIVGAIIVALVGGGLGLRELLLEPAPPSVDSAPTFKAIAARHASSTLFVSSSFRIRARSAEGEPVDIYEGHSFGTAFFISAQGYAVTNRHVVQPWLGDLDYAAAVADARSNPDNVEVEIISELTVWPADTEVRRPDQSLIFETGYTTHIEGNLEVVGFPPDRFVTQEHAGVEVEMIGPYHADLALLHVRGVELAPESIAPLVPVGEATPVLTEVMNIGFPGGDKVLEGTRAVPSVSTGMVKKVEENLQLDISVYPGNSGSPVWDLDGRIICVTTRQWGERYSECMPAQMIRELIRHLDVDIDLP